MFRTEDHLKMATTMGTTMGRQASDATRFERLVGESRRKAYSMALQLTRNASEAEDLMQDTLVKAWRGFESYIPGRPFLNWLLRIMQRAHLDNRRRDNPIRRAESLNSVISPADGEIQELSVADPVQNPERDALYQESRLELRRALDELPEVYRAAIVLCDLEGLSYSEIAENQKTTVGTVRSRIHRGRKLLRELILKRGIELPSAA